MQFSQAQFRPVLVLTHFWIAAESRTFGLSFSADADDIASIMKAERAHLRPQIARKDILAIDCVSARRDAVLREPADGLAQ